MRAVLVDRPGGPDALRIGEAADPVPGPGELLIDVAAAGVNRADVLQREGRYPPPPGASPTIGLEVAGVVAGMGAAVSGWAPGDRAMALLAGGGYAERASVPAEHAMPVPADMGLIEAAAVPEAFLTASHSLRVLSPADEHDRVLVHAAASGVGTAAIQMARALGASVAGTVRTPAKADAVSRLGAVPIVVGEDGRFAEAARDALGGGATVVVDLVGGSYWRETVASLAMDATISVVGLLGGATAEVDLAALMSRRTRVTAATLRPLPHDRKAALVADFRRWGTPLLEDGTLAPVVDRTFALAAAADAHRMLESNATRGKLVLRVDEE